MPFLRDAGMPPMAAARIASIIGLASIAGRVGAGFVLDRVESPVVATVVFLFGATGSALLLFYGSSAAIPAVICIGLMIGSEVDVIAYFVSRYFGTRHHSSIFGWQYAMVALGSSVGVYLVGWLRDVDGDYTRGLATVASLQVLAAVSCLLLGRYRYVAR